MKRFQHAYIMALLLDLESFLGLGATATAVLLTSSTTTFWLHVCNSV